MKVYYQTDGFSTCCVDSENHLKEVVELAIDECFFYKPEITEEQKDKIYLAIIKKVENGEVAKFNGFKFGSTEMAKEEFNALGEFMGW